MIIEFSDNLLTELINKYDKLTETSLEIKALRFLSDAQSEGNHKIIGTYEILEYLSTLEKLDNRVRNVYKFILSKCHMNKMHLSFCYEYIRIVSLSGKVNKVLNGDYTIYEIPLDFFSDMYSIGPTVLLSEHKDDCEFYDSMARRYIKEFGLERTFNLKVEHRIGGGSTTYLAYESDILNNKITLCITDSDRKNSQDQVGTTARDIQRVHDQYENDKPIGLLILNVREKENLIPPSYYLLSDNPSCRESLEKLMQFEHKENTHELLKYADIKSGINIKELFEVWGSEQIEAVIALFPSVDLYKRIPINKIGKDNSIFEGVSGTIKNFQSEVLNGRLEEKLSELLDKQQRFNIPESNVSKLKEKVERKKNLFVNSPSYIKHEWIRISNKVISWGYADVFYSGLS